MPNIKSAKKALRSSLRKKQYNNFWKNRIKRSLKTLKGNLETKGTSTDILNENLAVLQKILDKASKNKVIHKNRANRLKSRYAKKITAYGGKAKKTKSASEKAKKAD